jgi:hypothetical protein
VGVGEWCGLSDWSEVERGLERRSLFASLVGLF